MRNRFPGACYRCSGWVAAGEGHFERLAGKWRVQHATCAIEKRGTTDPTREVHRLRQLERFAAGTGRKAQRVRARLREIEAPR